MELLLWVVLGALAGWIASVIMGTDYQQGAVMNVALGVIGAFIGGLLMNLFGQPGVTGFNVYSGIVAVLGAVAVVWLGKQFIYR